MHRCHDAVVSAAHIWGVSTPCMECQHPLYEVSAPTVPHVWSVSAPHIGSVSTPYMGWRCLFALVQPCKVCKGCRAVRTTGGCGRSILKSSGTRRRGYLVFPGRALFAAIRPAGTLKSGHTMTVLDVRPAGQRRCSLRTPKACSTYKCADLRLALRNVT
jgi:hypothetical protein